jgi:hypothetical protein
MGFLDKAKQQAQQLTTKAQDSLNQGQQKLDATQNKKSVEAWLRDLGAWTYAQRAGRDEGRAEAEITVLTTQIEGWEAQFGPVTMPFATPGTGAPAAPSAPGVPAAPDVPAAPEAPAAPAAPAAPPPPPPPDFGASPPGGA